MSASFDVPRRTVPFGLTYLWVLPVTAARGAGHQIPWPPTVFEAVSAQIRGIPSNLGAAGAQIVACLMPSVAWAALSSHRNAGKTGRSPHILEAFPGTGCRVVL